MVSEQRKSFDVCPSAVPGKRAEVIMRAVGIVIAAFEPTLRCHLNGLRLAHQNKLHSLVYSRQIWLEKHLQTQIAS